MAVNKQCSLSSFLNTPSPIKHTENPVPTLHDGYLEGTSADTTTRKCARIEEQAEAATRAQHQYYETVTKPKRAAEQALRMLPIPIRRIIVADNSNDYFFIYYY
jgi:hypothetical protein